jgi:hypothetical protein
MIKTKVTVKIEVDKTLELSKSLKSINNMNVLVGVPEENTSRESGDVTNAQLVMWHTKGVKSKKMEQSGNDEGKYNIAQSVYITSKGSPLWKLPPRPIIEPALEADGNKERIEEDLKLAAQAMLDDNSSEAVRALNVAGQDGVNIIKAWFEDSRNNWPPVSDKTVQSRINKRYKSNKKRREAMKAYKSGEEGIKQILVDTGQMRSAMNYVVEVE